MRRALLAKAQKPIIVAGGGVVRSEAQQEVLELAEKLQIPVVTSLNAKSTIVDTHPLAEPIRPERICKAISDTLPPDGVLVSDTGHSGIWTGSMIDFKYPTQRYFRCAGSLGWGFPASLGVKCALPDKPVICFNGDGGFYIISLDKPKHPPLYFNFLKAITYQKTNKDELLSKETRQ